MVVPNYTYLKLKMPGPCRIIMTSASIKMTYTCERANCDIASTLVGLQEHIFEDPDGEAGASANVTDIAKRARIGA